MAISRSLAGTSLTILSPIYMSPEVISSNPAIIRKVVDLPQPEGPTRTINSLFSMPRLTLSTALTLPEKIFETLRKLTCAIYLFLHLNYHYIRLKIDSQAIGLRSPACFCGARSYRSARAPGETPNVGSPAAVSA